MLISDNQVNVLGKISIFKWRIFVNLGWKYLETYLIIPNKSTNDFTLK